MIRSLFSGVSGLKNHQTRMDVIGNNIANVNTVGFKSGRVLFKEGFAQLLSGATRPQNAQGGINPSQIGLGMQVASVDTIFNQGNIETTGVTTDLAIQGDAFFVLARGAERFYSRAGNFELDAVGRLVSGTNGFRVQGRMGSNGVLSPEVGDIRIPIGQQTPASETKLVEAGGNLDSTLPNGSTRENTITIYDVLGAKHELKISYTKTAANEWTVAAEIVGPPTVAVTIGPSDQLTFNNENGLLTGTGELELTTAALPGGVDPMTFTLDLGAGDVNGLTQFAGTTTAALVGQDGFMSGTLNNFTIDRTGTITGSFTNGQTLILGQVALALFNNPGGLTRAGENFYSTSANSGDAQLTFASADSPSSLVSGALEMSNVDLTQEFTNMIIAQRGFQANGRVITSTDEMLQEVVNLKR
jgi:flagellar hook protein FlgE